MMTRRNNILLLVSIFVAILSTIDNSHAFDLEKKVIKTRLKNGLTVLMMERHLSPTVSLYIRHRVGAVDEQTGQSGAAHLLEHMMFKGTTTIGTKNYRAEKKILDAIEETGKRLDAEKRKGPKADSKKVEQLSFRLKKLQNDHKKYFIPNEIDRLYTENGGLNMNASTGQDVTAYHVSLPVNKIELWARIESDRLLNPVFREFYTERDVVMEERRQRIEADPEGKLYEQFMSCAYKIHPYGRPVIGWEKDLMNLSPDSVRKIFAKYQDPASIVIAVVGDIKPQDTLKLIEKYFGRIPAGKINKDFIPEEPQQKEERRVKVEFDANPMMIIGFHKPNAPAREDYVLDVLDTILTNGRTSRLFKQLVTDRQIAKSVSSVNGFPATRYPNLFTIFAQPRHPHANRELEEIILQEIENLKNIPVTSEELAKAKNIIKTDYMKSLDSNSEIASMLTYYEVLLGDFRYISEYPRNIDQVNAEDIMKVVGVYFTKTNRTVAVLEKKKN